ncbi:hypothetical protein DRQ50_02560, partial [bacterium]
MTMIRIFATMLPLLVLALTGLAGCGADAPAEDGAAPGGDERRGGTAIIAMKEDPDVLNPLIRLSATAGRVIAALADPLMEMNEDLDWEPRIARSWELAADGSSVTFHLRPWVWSDGEPLTAGDVVLSLDLFKDPRTASPHRGFFEDVSGAVALDDSTVRYDFRRPVSDPLNRTFHGILPAHIVADLDPAEVAAWPINSRPVSSGAFNLDSWQRNRQLVLVRNDLYPLTPALLDRVVIRILPEAETRILALEAGEVDIVDQITPADAARLERNNKATVHATGGRSVYYLQWNCRRPALADATTRRALSLALNRQRLITTLMAGYAKPAASPVAPVNWNHHGDLPADLHNPVRAR